MQQPRSRGGPDSRAVGRGSDGFGLGAPPPRLHHEHAALAGGRRSATRRRPAVMPGEAAVGQLHPRVDGRPHIVIVPRSPPANTFVVSVGSDAGDETQAEIPDRPNGGDGATRRQETDGAAASTPSAPLIEGLLMEGEETGAVSAAACHGNGKVCWDSRLVSKELAMAPQACKGLGYQGEDDIDVYEDDSEEENGKRQRCRDASEQGERNRHNEEKRNDECVDWVEQRH